MSAFGLIQAHTILISTSFASQYEPFFLRFRKDLFASAALHQPVVTRQCVCQCVCTCVCGVCVCLCLMCACVL